MTTSDHRADGASASLTDAVTFSFDWYESFLREIRSEGYTFGRYGDSVAPGTVLLRHDVDLSPRRARRMAEIEADLGIESTYFVLVASPMYNVLEANTRETLTEIADLGHDIGVHFSTHQYWSPDAVPAAEAPIAERVRDERATLSTVLDPIETVSFHIPPERVLRREFDAFPSTYEPRFFTDIEYHGDSDQRWRGDPPDPAGFGTKAQVLVHPGLWGETDDPFEHRVHEGVAETRRRTATYARERYLAQEFG